jgi:transcription initiation factor TFIIIB Brf1 subunit/transcription initiation factor TFIIB
MPVFSVLIHFRGLRKHISSNAYNAIKAQKGIAEAAGVTEVTVRNRYKTLKKQLKLELPD